MSHWTEIPIHVLDFEGGPRTGIVEYGVATLHGGEITTTHTRVCRALAPIPALDTQCHGLRDADVAAERPFAAEAELFLKLRGCGLFAAHHAQVEQGMLKAVWSYPGAMPDFAAPGRPSIIDWGPWIDTHRLAAAWHPTLAEHKLGSLIRYFSLEKKLAALATKHCPPKRAKFHCALYDALAAALLLRHLCDDATRADVTVGSLVLAGLSGPRAAERIQGELELF